MDVKGMVCCDGYAVMIVAIVCTIPRAHGLLGAEFGIEWSRVSAQRDT